MDLRTFWRTVRVHWILIVGLTILGAVLGPVLVPAPHTSYTATVTVVATPQSSQDAYQQSLKNQYIKSRIDTWVALATDPAVLRPVYAETGPDTSYQDFQASVTASTVANTGILRIQVVAPTKDFAIGAAQMVADELAKLVQTQEAGNPGSISLARTGETLAVRSAGQSLEPLYAAAGAIVGLAIALVIATVRARSTTRIRVRDDLDRLGIDLPVAGELPRGYSAPRAPLSGDTSDKGQLANAARALRTAVLAAVPGGGTVVVTAPTRGEGASLTASRLAVALAEASHRVAYVDADLRRPTALKMFGLVPQPGLGEAVDNGTEVDAVVQHTGLPTLDVVVAGATPDDPSDLLASTAATALLAALAEEYDYVIVDAPPLSTYTDAAALGRDAAVLLLVVSATKGKRNPLTASLNALRSARVDNIEIVLNRGRSNPVRAFVTAGA